MVTATSVQPLAHCPLPLGLGLGGWGMIFLCAECTVSLFSRGGSHTHTGEPVTQKVARTDINFGQQVTLHMNCGEKIQAWQA